MQHAEQGEQMAARDLPTERAGMKDIVERLRNWRTVHLTQLRYLLESAADEIERLRLSASGSCPDPENAASEDKVSMRQNMTTLTLLSRTGSDDANVGEDAAKCTVARAKLPERERAEIERLRSRLRFADAVIRSGDVAALTSEEREAVQRARDSIASTMPYESVQSAADWKALSGLLERMG